MKERPILFSGPMVRALLSGAKTQTRRICKQADMPHGPAKAVYPARESGWIAWWGKVTPDLAEKTKLFYRDGFCCPYGQPGDRLWVRETWQVATGRQQGDLGACVRYRDMDLKACWMPADKPLPLGLSWERWRPSIHMPRWASRITLEVTGVRVERLQQISDKDAEAEGALSWAAEDLWPKCKALGVASPNRPRFLFETLWKSINGAESWKADPWAWVVEFTVAEVSRG